MDLFLGGSETTSTSLNWTILYLLHYPEVHGLKSTILNIMLTVGIFFFKKKEKYLINLNLPYRGFLNLQAYFWILGLWGAHKLMIHPKIFLFLKTFQQYFCDDKDDDAILM